jgi:hypothetical protein
MTTQKAESPRGGGGGGGRELLALADSWETGVGADHRRICANQLRTLATTLAAREDGWKLIASAPTDGTRVIGLFPSGYVAETSFQKTYSTWNVGGYTHLPWSDQPTHWQPLPKAPTAGEG